MREMIAGMQLSLDGYIEGPDREVDWIAGWADTFDLMPDIDTCVLGGGMYAGYAQYWRSILADPDAPSALTGLRPTSGEIEYARFADKTPHIVVSTTLPRVEWINSRLARSISEVRALMAAPGRSIYVIGGATLIGSLINEGLVDELRLSVHPLVLGGGTALFKDVHERVPLKLADTGQLEGGIVSLRYRIEHN